MPDVHPHEISPHEHINSKVSVNRGHWFRRFFSFAGPAYLISVGYMDPGNWATDIEGGSRFGYTLIWVLLMSNLKIMVRILVINPFKFK